MRHFWLVADTINKIRANNYKQITTNGGKLWLAWGPNSQSWLLGNGPPDRKYRKRVTQCPVYYDLNTSFAIVIPDSCETAASDLLLQHNCLSSSPETWTGIISFDDEPHENTKNKIGEHQCVWPIEFEATCHILWIDFFATANKYRDFII